MSNMYFRCQLPSPTLKILKCYNSKLQMLTSTVHNAVITTYINGPSCLYFIACVHKHFWQYMNQCDLVQLRPHLMSGYTVYCCCICFLINMGWILIYFGKLVFLYKIYYFLLICISIITTVLPLSDFVFINYFLFVSYEFVLLYVTVFCVKCLWCFEFLICGIF